MYISPEVFEDLKNNPKLTANKIAVKHKISKSTAYRYIAIFKNMDLQDEFNVKRLTSHHNKNLTPNDFDIFLLDIVNDSGFNSTLEFFNIFKKHFPLSNYISRRTFNRYFLESRIRQKQALKETKLRITTSKNKPRIGFFTVKRIKAKQN